MYVKIPRHNVAVVKNILAADQGNLSGKSLIREISVRLYRAFSLARARVCILRLLQYKHSSFYLRARIR